MSAALWRRDTATGGRLVLFLVWAVVVGLTCVQHIVWRDEVRALSFALQGADVAEMLQRLQGEGHPAVWYLLLRGAHAVVDRPEVLQGVAALVAAIAAVLLVARSPFSLLLMALLLFGRGLVYEYSVVARNYGISVPLLFALAICYARHRSGGVVLGGLLFLLADCNAHSVLLVGAFLLFWLLDIRREPALWRTWLLNAGVAAVGVTLAVATIYPPANDAVVITRDAGELPGRLVLGTLLPAVGFEDLFRWAWPRPAPVAGNALPGLGRAALLSLLLVGSTLGLRARPAALIAAIAALVAFSVFFLVVYPGSYRHAALWLTFLVSLYWIAGREAAGSGRVGRVGGWLLVALLAIQVPAGFAKILPVVTGRVPESRSRDLARLIAERPALREAIIVADPDFLVEPLPYYITNTTYLLRDQRFGRYAVFTEHALLQLSLSDILAQAHALSAAAGKPVVILLQHRLDPAAPATDIAEGYNWHLLLTPEQVRAFQGATTRIASLPRALSDESYDVYVLDGAGGGPAP